MYCETNIDLGCPLTLCCAECLDVRGRENCYDEDLRTFFYLVNIVTGLNHDVVCRTDGRDEEHQRTFSR